MAEDELPEGTPTGVVQAVGVVNASVGNDPSLRNARAQAIEAAMVKAIEEAQAEGADDEEIRKRILAARDLAANTFDNAQ